MYRTQRTSCRCIIPAFDVGEKWSFFQSHKGHFEKVIPLKLNISANIVAISLYFFGFVLTKICSFTPYSGVISWTAPSVRRLTEQLHLLHKVSLGILSKVVFLAPVSLLTNARVICAWSFVCWSPSTSVQVWVRASVSGATVAGAK